MTQMTPTPAMPAAAPVARQSPPKKRRKNSREHNLAGYLFISPWLFAFFAFTLIPIIASLYLAFTDYDILSSPTWVGLDNFERMFLRDSRYMKSLKATFYYVFTAVPLRLAFALFVAMLLNTKRRMVGVYRAAYYAPSIVGGSVAVAVMWREIFGRNGLINAIFDTNTIWLGNPSTAIWTLVLLAVWQFGSPMLIFLMRPQADPLRSATAGSFGHRQGQRLASLLESHHPLLTPIIFFNLIMQTISGFMVFTQAFIITGGAPLDTTLFYALYVYQQGFVTYSMGYASAMAWVLLVIVAFFTAIVFKSSSYWVFYETKEG